MGDGRSKREETSDQLRAQMAEALLALMEQEPIGKITAQEIASTAGVGRATWFRLFGSKEEALVWQAKRLWHSYWRNRSLDETEATDRERGDAFFRFNYENRDFLRLVYRQGMKHTLYDVYYQLIMPAETSDVMAGYVARCAAYAAVGLLDEWVTRDFAETPEQLIALARMASPA